MDTQWGKKPLGLADVRACSMQLSFYTEQRSSVIKHLHSQRLMGLFFSSCLSMNVSVLFIDIILIRVQSSGSVATWCGFIQLHSWQSFKQSFIGTQSNSRMYFQWIGFNFVNTIAWFIFSGQRVCTQHPSQSSELNNKFDKRYDLPVHSYLYEHKSVAFIR